jgi:hypothetical protein
VATQAGLKLLADHAMRIQLAARGEHAHKASAAIDRLEELPPAEIDPNTQSETLLKTCP